MGNACCGSSEERPKATAFQPASGFSVVDPELVDAPHAEPPTSAAATPAAVSAPSSLEDAKLREEELRLEGLVQTAGRAMVAVRSTRGSNPYYDQGFASALAQHLEQTTDFPALAPTLPAVPTQGTAYSRLSQPAWEDLLLGTKGGLAGCAGENPEKYLDHVAEFFLDQVVPKKEQVFTKAQPIVESLL
jgi:hypothetical protein